jgi:hypothetical protein
MLPRPSKQIRAISSVNNIPCIHTLSIVVCTLASARAPIAAAARRHPPRGASLQLCYRFGQPDIQQYARSNARCVRTAKKILADEEAFRSPLSRRPAITINCYIFISCVLSATKRSGNEPNSPVASLVTFEALPELAYIVALSQACVKVALKRSSDETRPPILNISCAHARSDSDRRCEIL